MGAAFCVSAWRVNTAPRVKSNRLLAWGDTKKACRKARFKEEPRKRFELSTCSLRVSCSTAELTRLDKETTSCFIRPFRYRRKRTFGKIPSSAGKFLCRDDKIRTCDLNVPNVARYQLRYIPIALDFFYPQLSYQLVIQSLQFCVRQ